MPIEEIRFELDGRVTPDPFSDSFDRADSTTSLGAPWIVYIGTWGIQGNQAFASDTPTVQTLVVVPAFRDGEFSVTISGAGGGIIFASPDSANYLQAIYHPAGHIELSKWDAGALTILQNVGQGMTGGRMTVVLDGSDIAVRHGDTTLARHRLTAAEASKYVGTRVGMRAEFTTLRFNDFSAVSKSADDPWTEPPSWQRINHTNPILALSNRRIGAKKVWDKPEPSEFVLTLANFNGWLDRLHPSSPYKGLLTKDRQARLIHAPNLLTEAEAAFRSGWTPRSGASMTPGVLRWNGANGGTAFADLTATKPVASGKRYWASAIFEDDPANPGGSALCRTIIDWFGSAPGGAVEVGTHPDAPLQSTALGKSLTALHAYNGRIYAGYGDTFNNTGGDHIASMDPDKGTWIVHRADAGTERLGRYRQIGSQLWVSADDGRGRNSNRLYGWRSGDWSIDRRLDGILVNLVTAQQSSFENTAQPPGWVPTDANTSIAISTEQAYEGAAALRVQRANTTSGPTDTTTPTGVDSIEVDAIAVEEGQIYRVRGRIFTPSSRTYRINLLFYDASGAPVASGLAPTGTFSSGWGLFSSIFFVPAGARSAAVQATCTTDTTSADPAWRVDEVGFWKWAYTAQTWTLGGTSARTNFGPIHTYDFCERVPGEIYVVGSSSATFGAGLARSTDGGITWEPILFRIANAASGGKSSRFYNVGALNGVVYTVFGGATDVETTSEKYIEDAGEQCHTWDNVVLGRGPKLDGFIKPVNFASRLVYRSKDGRLLSFDGTNVVERRAITCIDHAVEGDRLYVVQNGRVFVTTDLVNWTDLTSAPTVTTSLAVLNGRPFFGGSDSKVYATDFALSSPTFLSSTFGPYVDDTNPTEATVSGDPPAGAVSAKAVLECSNLSTNDRHRISGVSLGTREPLAHMLVPTWPVRWTAAGADSTTELVCFDRLGALGRSRLPHSLFEYEAKRGVRYKRPTHLYMFREDNRAGSRPPVADLVGALDGFMRGAPQRSSDNNLVPYASPSGFPVGASRAGFGQWDIGMLPPPAAARSVAVIFRAKEGTGAVLLQDGLTSEVYSLRIAGNISEGLKLTAYVNKSSGRSQVFSDPGVDDDTPHLGWINYRDSDGAIFVQVDKSAFPGRASTGSVNGHVNSRWVAGVRTRGDGYDQAGTEVGMVVTWDIVMVNEARFAVYDDIFAPWADDGSEARLQKLLDIAAPGVAFSQGASSTGTMIPVNFSARSPLELVGNIMIDHGDRFFADLSGELQVITSANVPAVKRRYGVGGIPLHDIAFDEGGEAFAFVRWRNEEGSEASWGKGQGPEFTFEDSTGKAQFLKGNAKRLYEASRLQSEPGGVTMIAVKPTIVGWDVLTDDLYDRVEVAFTQPWTGATVVQTREVCGIDDDADARSGDWVRTVHLRQPVD